MKTLAIVLNLCLPILNVSGQICGPLDLGFGQSGKVYGLTTGFVPGRSFEKIMLQSDHRIIQVVDANNGNAATVGLIRYTRDGQVDPSFGLNGSTSAVIPNYNLYAASATILKDDKILIAGHSYYSRTHDPSDIFILRYTRNGQLDSSFGNQGKIIFDLGQSTDYASDMVVLPDGKFMVVGSSADEKNIFAWTAVRYLENGTLDNTFGNQGRIITHPGPVIAIFQNQPYNHYSNEYASGILLLPGGGFIISGTSYINDNCFDYYGSIYCPQTSALMRFLPDGKPDSTFGTMGKVIDEDLIYITSIALQSDEKILVTGNINGERFRTIRYTTGGARDHSFGVNGQFDHYINGGPDHQYFNNSMLIHPDGKITTVGNFVYGDSSYLMATRLFPDGKQDQIYGWNKTLQLHVGSPGSRDEFRSAVLQFNKILVGGFSSDNNGLRAVVIRLMDEIPTPIITGNKDLLSTTPGYFHYQWFENGIPILWNYSHELKPSRSGIFKVTITNPDGCSRTSEDFNLIVLASKDISKARVKVVFYPNPVKGMLYLDVTEFSGLRLEATLSDVNGRIRLKQRLNPFKNQMDVQQLPSGVYHLMINNQEEVISRNLMVIR